MQNHWASHFPLLDIWPSIGCEISPPGRLWPQSRVVTQPLLIFVSHFRAWLTWGVYRLDRPPQRDKGQRCQCLAALCCCCLAVLSCWHDDTLLAQGPVLLEAHLDHQAVVGQVGDVVARFPDVHLDLGDQQRMLIVIVIILLPTMFCN